MKRRVWNFLFSAENCCGVASEVCKDVPKFVNTVATRLQLGCNWVATGLQLACNSVAAWFFNFAYGLSNGVDPLLSKQSTDICHECWNLTAVRAHCKSRVK